MQSVLKLRYVIAGVSAVAAISSAMLAPAVAADGAATAPAERAKSVAKGELKNPLAISPEIIDEGKALYQAKTCGACHGTNGSGIHCPSLKNEAWIYGSDDDTLFRLITLGSEELLASGYNRGDTEKHAGPMPSFSTMISDEQELWKIIAYIRSLSAETDEQK